MENFGWTLHTRPDRRDEIAAQIHALLCEHLNLCASVGCSCVTGSDEPPLCFEAKVGERFPVYHSEGPTWAITIICQDTIVLVQGHTSDPLILTELRRAYLALHRFEQPLFGHTHYRVPPAPKAADA